MKKSLIPLILAGLMVSEITHALVVPSANNDVVSQAQVQVSTTTSATAKLAANRNRRYLYIQNQDNSNPIYVSFSNSAGVTASSTFGVIKLSGAVSGAPSNVYAPVVPPTNAVYLFTTSGTVSATVISGN